MKKISTGKTTPCSLKKMLRIMRLTLFVLLVFVSQVFATDLYSQQTKLNLLMSDTRVGNVLDEIENQSEFYFLFNQSLIDMDRTVSLALKNKSITEVLDAVFAKTDVKYVISDRQIILNVDDKPDFMGASQLRKVSGQVTENNGQPLPGVTVVVKNSTTGTITDDNGNYQLDVPEGAEVLLFTFIGMRTVEETINNRMTIDVAMEPDVVGLEEVIAVGYASQKKANIVGSVTSISGEKIASIPAPDISNAISGRMPGSVVIQQSGEPGQNSAKILVRGRTTLGDDNDDPSITAPLVVVDGIPGRSLGDIDPVDIESISVLKDASAAIYGATAANGVILVTTKKGKSGKPTLSYQFYQGFMTPTILPEVTNAGDYATMLSEYQDYEGKPRTFTDEDIDLFYSGRDPWEHPNSDWVGDLIADWTTTSKHNISLDGGSNGMYYYVSFGYKNEEAIYEQESTNYKQYNLRAKLEIPITDWLKTSVDYAGFLNNKLYPTKGAGAIYGQSTRLVPTQWSFWPTGEPGPDIEYGDNPVVTSTLEGGSDDQKSYINQTTFGVTVTPPFIKGLTLSGMYTYDVTNLYRKRFRKPWTLYFPKWDTAVRDSEGFITSMELTPTLRGYSAPELVEDYDRSIRKLTNINFNYARDFGDHSFNLFGAYEEVDQNSNYFGAFRKYYISEVVKTLDAGADADQDNWGSMDIYARKSLIGRLNYNYKGKYLLEAIIRRDGSLKFPPDSRWGNFPGLLLGWRASEEDFWKSSLGFINYFKLRGSYGKMGMDPGDPFQFMNKYILASGLTLGTDKVVETVVRQEGVANPFITWEKQTTYNLGFESQLLENMFSLNADFFYSKRSDILASRDASVPDFTGLALPDENIAEVDNRGFEIEAGYHKTINRDLRFDLGGNIAYNHNEVVFMDEPERAQPWQQRTGHPFGATLLYNAIGIFADQAAVDSYPSWPGAKPGDVIFEDVSGDGKITGDDRILLDKTDAPELFYGISLDVNYKNWSLSMLAQGQGTYYRMNIADGRRGEAGNYFQWSFDNRWTTENIHTDVARAYNRDDLYWAFDVNNSTYHYNNMAYCRLKNAILTYHIPNRLFGNSGISRASVYFAGNNLFLIYAAQKNFDPEIGAPMTYPAVKTFAIGARVTF
ncbi:TonB-dependent receptor [uncultured Sunxiuqinia sp.]|uniref:TonB-dependent receptor n=1 Tax=uncultured Sunxiuqinia sp. TaxID=1573825 RepID=UPI0026126D7F|nr:TonB-dependent receptor [uncultured Sunxiuqinia sp.]